MCWLMVNLCNYRWVPLQYFGSEGIPSCINEGGRGGLCWTIGNIRLYKEDPKKKYLW